MPICTLRIYSKCSTILLLATNKPCSTHSPYMKPETLASINAQYANNGVLNMLAILTRLILGL